ncbi:MAG: glycosyltransferase [Victivallales bacterium]|jgi:glycosyltransferase involved in cell wall biosynthesis
MVNSSLPGEELLKKGFDIGKICVVRNIVEKADDDPDEKDVDIRRENRIPENAILVTGIGRNAIEKDFNFFIDVFAKASAENSRLHGLILGSGGPPMSGKIKNLGLEGKFTLPGEVKSVMPFLKASDIFFLSSKHEGMANALLEALQAGCSILTTNVGGCTDIFESCNKDVLEKILLDDRDPDKAAAKLLSLSQNNSIRDYLKTNSEAFISKFSHERIMPEYYKALGLESL